MNLKLKYMFLRKKRVVDTLLSIINRPQFYFRTTDVTGEIFLTDGREMVMPGDNVTISVKLIVPIAMDKGLRFAIRRRSYSWCGTSYRNSIVIKVYSINVGALKLPHFYNKQV